MYSLSVTSTFGARDLQFALRLPNTSRAYIWKSVEARILHILEHENPQEAGAYYVSLKFKNCRRALPFVGVRMRRHRGGGVCFLQCLQPENLLAKLDESRMVFNFKVRLMRTRRRHCRCRLIFDDHFIFNMFSASLAEVVCTDVRTATQYEIVYIAPDYDLQNGVLSPVLMWIPTRREIAELEVLSVEKPTGVARTQYSQQSVLQQARQNTSCSAARAWPPGPPLEGSLGTSLEIDWPKPKLRVAAVRDGGEPSVSGINARYFASYLILWETWGVGKQGMGSTETEDEKADVAKDAAPKPTVGP
ncbi:hypothetical protein BKA93DRAFT_747051 [Sparassis latifolia]